MTAYRWSTLTAAIADKASPLRQHLDNRFPHHLAVRKKFAATAGPLLVDGGSANAGTIGTSFDLAIRLLLDPNHTPQAVLGGGALDRSEQRELWAVLEETVRAARADDATILTRGCWALALGVEAYRMGAVVPGSPLAVLRASGAVVADTLIASVPQAVVDEVSALIEVARERLLPHLDGDLTIGPTFDGSRHCRADADLIAGSNLVELKTKLGPKNARTGIRRDVLDLPDLLQVITYALFDFSDRYGVTDVAIYSARYGTYWKRPLQEFLSQLAGSSMGLAAERASVRRIVTGN